MKRMTGPAWIVWIAQSNRSTATGADLDQTHARHSPIRRSPERTDAGARHGDEGRQSRQDQNEKQNPACRRGQRQSGGLSAAVRSANLAMNPDSGGSPEITRAQPMKAIPRMPIVAGNCDADFL